VPLPFVFSVFDIHTYSTPFQPKSQEGRQRKERFLHHALFPGAREKMGQADIPFRTPASRAGMMGAKLYIDKIWPFC
jgi:hypothetical protein